MAKKETKKNEEVVVEEKKAETPTVEKMVVKSKGVYEEK